MRTIEDNAFLLLIIAVSLAFFWSLLPFYGAVLWGIVIAIVILPMTLIGASVTQEALGFYGKVQSGELDIVRFFQQVHDILPAWAISLLDRFGLASLDAVQQKISGTLMAGSQYIATQVLNIG